MYTLGPGLWQEILKNVENEKCTIQDLKIGEKPEKSEKMRNAHCRSWNMVRKLKNVENETQKLYDLEYCEKH